LGVDAGVPVQHAGESGLTCSAAKSAAAWNMSDPGCVE
jgi:hypothetical protein